MLRAVLRRLFARGSSDEADDEVHGVTRFVPSPLDLSVRYAHGGRTRDVDRELADIDDHARRLEESDRNR